MGSLVEKALRPPPDITADNVDNPESGSDDLASTGMDTECASDVQFVFVDVKGSVKDTGHSKKDAVNTNEEQIFDDVEAAESVVENVEIGCEDTESTVDADDESTNVPMVDIHDDLQGKMSNKDIVMDSVV